MNYVFFPPRTSLKPRLTVNQPIISPVLLPTLLQIYCIGLETHFFWVWAAICDPTICMYKYVLYIYIYKYVCIGSF